MACKPCNLSGHDVEASHSRDNQKHNINLQETNSYGVQIYDDKGLWMLEYILDMYLSQYGSRNFEMFETSVVVEECSNYFKQS